VHLSVPPSDVQLWPEIQLLPEITVFDPEWVIDTVAGMTSWIQGVARDVVTAMVPSIIDATFKSVEPYLDSLAADFYRRRG